MGNRGLLKRICEEQGIETIEEHKLQPLIRS